MMKMRDKKAPLILIVLALSTLLFLTHDIILTHILAYQICKADPNPKTFITHTVEYPESIYWEDNIYPGFDEKDRLLMIRNYLDGVHLKTMALNAPDGSIYLFTATQEDWQISQRMTKETSGAWSNYFDALTQEAKVIASRGRVISSPEKEQFNYSVVFNSVDLTPLQKRYLYCDEVVITDRMNNEVIGYNRRLMRRWYMLLPDFELGNRYYWPEALCGMGGLIYFDEMVITVYGRNLVPAKHREFINYKLYMRFEND